MPAGEPSGFKNGDCGGLDCVLRRSRVEESRERPLEYRIERMEAEGCGRSIERECWRKKIGPRGWGSRVLEVFCCIRLMYGHVIVSIMACKMFNIYPMLIDIWISFIFHINIWYFFDEIWIGKYNNELNNHMPNWNTNLFYISCKIRVSI